MTFTMWLQAYDSKIEQLTGMTREKYIGDADTYELEICWEQGVDPVQEAEDLVEAVNM